jgi:hypothetical protein
VAAINSLSVRLAGVGGMAVILGCGAIGCGAISGQ